MTARLSLLVRLWPLLHPFQAAQSRRFRRQQDAYMEWLRSDPERRARIAAQIPPVTYRRGEDGRYRRIAP